MDLFGIGGMELVAILVIALIVLGPGRLVDGLRTLGKHWGQARRLLREIADSATINIPEYGSDRESAASDQGDTKSSTHDSSNNTNGENLFEEDEKRG
jgi:Sec-independent protein translocase protein TatA